DGGRGEAGGPGQLAGRHVPAEAEDVQAVQVGRVDADLVGGRGAHELHQGPGPAQAGREGRLEIRALPPPRPGGRRLGPRRLPAGLGAPARRRLPARLGLPARLCFPARLAIVPGGYPGWVLGHALPTYYLRRLDIWMTRC